MSNHDAIDANLLIVEDSDIIEVAIIPVYRKMNTLETVEVVEEGEHYVDVLEDGEKVRYSRWYFDQQFLVSDLEPIR